MPWRWNVGRPFSLKNSEAEEIFGGTTPAIESSADEMASSSGGIQTSFSVIPSSNTASFELQSDLFEPSQSNVFGLEPGWWHDGSNQEHARQKRARTSEGAMDLGASRLCTGPVLSDSSFSQLMATAFSANAPLENLKMPWEKGPFKDLFESPVQQKASDLFGKGTDWVRADEQSGLEDITAKLFEVQEPRVELTGAVYEKVIMALSDETCKMNIAVSRWHCILSFCLLASTTGRHVATFGAMTAVPVQPLKE